MIYVYIYIHTHIHLLTHIYIHIYMCVHVSKACVGLVGVGPLGVFVEAPYIKPSGPLMRILADPLIIPLEEFGPRFMRTHGFTSICRYEQKTSE